MNTWEYTDVESSLTDIYGNSKCLNIHYMFFVYSLFATVWVLLIGPRWSGVDGTQTGQILLF